MKTDKLPSGLMLPHPDTVSDETLPEHRFDYSNARLNRFAARLAETQTIELEPDAAVVFTAQESVNAVYGRIEMETPQLQQDSVGWRFFVQASFVMSLALMTVGIWQLPVNMWIRGFLGMGLFFTVSSTIVLTKTMRDDHEAQKLIKRLTNAKTEKMLQDYEIKP